MKNILIALCLISICVSCASGCESCSAEQAKQPVNKMLGQMNLIVPTAALAGNDVTLRGSGAMPGEAITLSTSAIITVTTSESMYHLGVLKMLLHQGDVLSIKANPVSDMLLGYMHSNLQSKDPKDVHNYPAYLKLAAQNGIVYWSMPSNWSGESVNNGVNSNLGKWLKIIAGGESTASKVNIILTVKRVVIAGPDGAFSTSVYIPFTKLIRNKCDVDSYTINAVGSNKSAAVPVTISAKMITDEPPIAFIYAPTSMPANSIVPAENAASYEMAPVAKVGQNVTLDGRYSVDNDGSIVSYQWDFGDGTKSMGALVQHVYKNAGKYNVLLKVEDNKGNTDTMTLPMAVS